MRERVCECVCVYVCVCVSERERERACVFEMCIRSAGVELSNDQVFVKERQCVSV